jgi:rSAM/selenodomain-associated transferase 2
LNSISVIIPTYNEADVINSLIRYLIKNDRERSVQEIIVVDGGSVDATCSLAHSAGADVIQSQKPGRAIQMNVGAKHASGDVLYFLHADSLPPEDYLGHIHSAWQNGFNAGCFRLRFDANHWLLSMYSWFTRLPYRPFRYGDQSLYIGRRLFLNIGGFREDLTVMEDNEIMGRITRNARFCVMPGYVTTSARKYLDNGVFRLQFIFTCIYFMYHLGFSQTTIVRFYKNFVRNGKKPIAGVTKEIRIPYTRIIH